MQGVEHRQQRDELLKYALEVFDAQGLQAPLREITARSGIPTAKIYRHFATRDDLLRALYDDCGRILEEIGYETLTTARGTSTERLTQFIADQLSWMLKHPCLPALLAQGLILYPDRVTEPLVASELVILVAAARSDGVVADEITARDIMLSTLVVSSLSAHESLGLRSSWQRMLGIVMRGLAPAPGAIPLVPLKERSN